MPVKWHKTLDGAPEISGASSVAGAEPLASLTLWPHRSLPRTGFAGFIGVTFLLLLIPLFAVLGTLVLWALLPFMMGTLALLWFFLERSYKSAELREDLSIWHDRMELIRSEPGKEQKFWQANPYWVSLHIHDKGGPVEHYLTLKGGDREVELGAFLSPEERLALRDELDLCLRRVNRG
ncbi:MAG: DUF2244 domain-containing protein [Rhodobacteraceae bacterium]|nr:DUF2244 domain-containing protein [Paracoccaceae bacterium]